MRGLRLVFLLVGTMLLAAGVVAGSVVEQARSQLDHALSVEAGRRAAIVQDHFDHARDIVLLAAQNPVFAQFYADPGTRDDRIAGQPALMARLNEALTYLETLYPGRISEACVIDGAGGENARVVRGEVAAPADLSPDESHNPFFAPTLALPPGRVFQASPYESPDTGEWVISNSTPVPHLTGARAILHFEITMESLRRAIAPSDPRYEVRIVDRGTGTVISDSHVPQVVGAPLGAPDNGSLRRLAGATAASGLTAVGDQAVAYQRLVPGDLVPGPGTATNQNDWMIVVSTPRLPSPWSGRLAPGPVGLTLAGLVMLVLAGLGFRQHHRQLYERARTDGLTGLANRLRFGEELATALAGSPPHKAAVLLLDLDRFKAVNDTLGHQAGDELLVEVGRRLHQAVRPTHVVARLGGDEFAVLMPGLTDDAEPVRLAAELQRTLHRATTLDGTPVAISASIGISLAPLHASDPSRLLRCADIAMYHAKRTASGFSTYAPEQDTYSLASLGLEAALLAAIEHRQLVLYYQPATDPRTGAVRRVEALVRWRHPDLGLIPPGDFLPLAEETGLMHALTRYVLETALDQYLRWRADGLDLQISVNLSPTNCMDTQLPADLLTMLEARELPPRVLRLEVTEYAALATEAEAVLNTLHQLGFSLALDDFGTGYSSLAYLRQVPTDDIKIDRSFVAALAHDPTDTIIIRSTIELAHELGLTVTAEGVEDEETLRRLRLLGADSVQGNLVCRPLPPRALARWIRETRRPLTAPAP